MGKTIIEQLSAFGTGLRFEDLPPEVVEAGRDLGTDFRMMQVYFKPYPCCRWLHAPVYALLGLMKRHGISREEIERIDVGGPEFAMMYNTRSGYESKVTCQYSIPYSVGAAAWFGRLGLEEFEGPARTDKGLMEFISRIHMRVDEGLQAQFPKVFGVILTLTLKDGRTFQTQQGTPWGPDAPPAKEELIDKFQMLTRGVLHPEDQEEWVGLYQKGFQQEGSFARMLALTEKQV